ncbi:hypothetical protein SB816_33890, partial [Achromobacter sp. SIMBA_011]|uniref:hypothetical protein n=1 Tax=Achromobacter sp. SIMBA_011 TaxID=3085759 RepID=UPI0039793C38
LGMLSSILALAWAVSGALVGAWSDRRGVRKPLLIVAVILPGIGWLVSKINRRLRRLNREHQTLTNELSYIVEETVGGYKVVK